jgi:glycosyltransferase involved in cell wall biosynthesis
MKIVFCVPRYHTNMSAWVEVLLNNGHDVYVHAIVRGNTENHTIVEPLIVRLSKVSTMIMRFFGSGGANKLRGFPEIFAYSKLLKDIDPDIIIVRGVNRWFSILVLFLSIFQSSKIIIYSQTELYKKYSYARNILTTSILNFFSATWITPLLGDCNKYNNYPDKMFYVPFLYLSPHLEPDLNSRSLRLLTVGKYTARKNHMMLLMAFNNLMCSGTLMYLTICGEVSTAEHKKNFSELLYFVRENNLSKFVKLISNQPHSEMNKIYSQSNLFVLPASSEPASYAIIEALAHGMPVICSSSCGTKWYVGDNCGLIFKDKSISELESSIKRYTNSIFHNKSLLAVKKSNDLNGSGEDFYQKFLSALPSRKC